MLRQRTIVGIGEALLIERPEGVAAGGLALDTALHAQRAGHIGVPISRIGQDLLANELLTILGGHELDTSHLQSDPDLKTGQIVIRRMVGREQRSVDPRAAFDNLQWDFDLEDIAQQADAAVFGVLGCRDGQSRSVHERFLSACPAAVRVCDLSNASAEDPNNRGIALSILLSANVAIVNRIMLEQIMPGSGSERSDAMRRLLREGNLMLAVFAQADEAVELHTAATVAVGAQALHAESMSAVPVALLHGLLAGWNEPDVVRCIDRVTTYTSEQPTQRIPEDVLQAK
jgi:sugar/nucleoside kinase (ribokinase family)